MFGAARLTDDEIRAAAEGSRADLGRVIEALEPQVRLMVTARLSPTPAQLDAVDEIAQDVLLAVTTGLERLEHPTVDGLRAWLSGIVVRKVVDLIRQRGRKGPGSAGVRSLDSTIVDLSEGGPLWQLLSASGISPPSAAANLEYVEGVVSALGRLTPRYRDMITLAFFDQLSLTEISRQNGSSRAAASMLLLRALRALREEMNGSLDGERDRGGFG